MKPVCVPCERFMRMERSGVAFVEGMPKAAGAAPGRREPESWRGYKLWYGDLWECPDCGASIVSGVGLEPVSEHYRPDFEAQCKARGAELLVKDC